MIAFNICLNHLVLASQGEGSRAAQSPRWQPGSTHPEAQGRSRHPPCSWQAVTSPLRGPGALTADENKWGFLRPQTETRVVLRQWCSRL